ncbi:hypothetical protein ACFXPV_03710 [Streptomyces sp. NPDC059118]|uniref:hypothetical protein n=1 Tax=unclassified Streptomyces TaxID=2593676 RepID=UPI0036B40971
MSLNAPLQRARNGQADHKIVRLALNVGHPGICSDPAELIVPEPVVDGDLFEGSSADTDGGAAW